VQVPCGKLVDSALQTRGPQCGEIAFVGAAQNISRICAITKHCFRENHSKQEKGSYLPNPLDQKNGRGSLVEIYPSDHTKAAEGRMRSSCVHARRRYGALSVEVCCVRVLF